MARGGYRPGAGRPKGTTKKGSGKRPSSSVVAAARKAVAASEEVLALAPDSETPLAYMLSVMNDPSMDEARRDKMAVAAAPFVHPRMADNRFGKRDGEKEAASRAGKTGRFAPPDAPKLVVDNR